MGVDLLDVLFRLERVFGVRIARADFLKLFHRHRPPDATVGELFDLVASHARHAGVADEELDAAFFWPRFRQVLADALGLDPDEIAKDRWFFRDLGV